MGSGPGPETTTSPFTLSEVEGPRGDKALRGRARGFDFTQPERLGIGVGAEAEATTSPFALSEVEGPCAGRASPAARPFCQAIHDRLTTEPARRKRRKSAKWPRIKDAKQQMPSDSSRLTAPSGALRRA